jgi:chromosome segregation ATPase
MADEPDNLVLEHLRHMRKVLDKLETDVADLKPRILGFETTMGHVMAQMGHLQVQIASQTGRLDRMDGRLDQIEGRLDRIEKRLDLVPA